ncbi:MAG: HpcH/HpaI aldolase/citrate lyase family protein, partial [Reyranellales bacterium]
MPTPNLRSLVGTQKPKIGTFLFEFATPGIGQILKAAGADYAVLDMEHTGFGFDTVRQVVRYCQATELPLIVRVPSQSRHHISRALDTGADGIMVPIVSSVAQAKAVLDAAKYWPDGTRGVALGLAHERFAMRSESLLQRFAEQNARTAIILQIEDPRGADAADQIAALPGVDMLWLGHNDLSVALDKPG